MEHTFSIPAQIEAANRNRLGAPAPRPGDRPPLPRHTLAPLALEIIRTIGKITTQELRAALQASRPQTSETLAREILWFLRDAGHLASTTELHHGRRAVIYRPTRNTTH